jgi:hypothetical protein
VSCELPDLARDFLSSPWHVVSKHLLGWATSLSDHPVSRHQQTCQPSPSSSSDRHQGERTQDMAPEKQRIWELMQRGLIVTAYNDPTRLHLHPCTGLGLRQHAASRTRDSCICDDARARCINIALTYLVNKLCLLSKLHSVSKDAAAAAASQDQQLLTRMLQWAREAAQGHVALPLIMLAVWESLDILQACFTTGDLHQLLMDCVQMCQHLKCGSLLAKVRCFNVRCNMTSSISNFENH